MLTGQTSHGVEAGCCCLGVVSTPTRGVRRVSVFLSNNTRPGVKNTCARSTAVSLSFSLRLDAPCHFATAHPSTALESARRETHSQPLAYIYTNTPHSRVPTPATGHPQRCNGWQRLPAASVTVGNGRRRKRAESTQRPMTVAAAATECYIQKSLPLPPFSFLRQGARSVLHSSP